MIPRKILFFITFGLITISHYTWALENANPSQSDYIEVLYPEFIADDISDHVNNLADWLDSFFGEARADDEREESTVRFIPSYTFYDGHPNESSLAVNINLKLNNFEKKSREIENDIVEKITAKPEVISKNNKKSYLPAKSKKISPSKIVKKEDWILNLETNAIVKSYLFITTKLRTRKNFEINQYIHHFAIEAGWDSELYWTTHLILNSDAPLSTTLLFRFVNEATWYLSGQNLISIHGPSLIKSINEYNSISLNFRKSYIVINNSSVLDNTSYSINWRNSTPSKKIFLDIIPDFSYPRLWNYAETRSLTFRLEYVF